MKPLLKHAKVEGLFGRHIAELNFAREGEGPPSRLTIVFDENGRGKTTILKAIHHLLSWVEPDPHLVALAELPVESVSLELEGGAAAFRRSPDDPRACTVEVESSEGAAVVEYDPERDDPRMPRRLVVDRSALNRFREIMSSLTPPPILVSDDRIIRGDDLLERGGPLPTRERDPRRSPRESGRLERWDPSHELRLLLDLLGRNFIRAAYRSRQRGTRTDAVYADVVNRIADDKIKEAVGDVEALRERAQRIEERLSLARTFGMINLSQLEQVESTLARLRRNSRNKKVIETVLEPFFSTLEADAEALKPVAERVDLLVSTVNEYLRDKELDFSPPDGLTIVPLPRNSEDGPLDPYQLSSGERHLLLLFGSAAIADHQRIILVDEPELSLGISWKRQLLKSLLELTEESEAQFVVASHSVEIISPFRDRAIQLRP